MTESVIREWATLTVVATTLAALMGFALGQRAERRRNRVTARELLNRQRVKR